MQVKHNKHELLEIIGQLGSAPLTPENIRNLAALGGAYDALCRVHPDGTETEHWEHKEHMEPAKPAARP